MRRTSRMLAAVLLAAPLAAAGAPLAAVPAQAAASLYRLSTAVDPDGVVHVTRWGHCRTVHFRVNVSLLPEARRDAGVTMVRAATARLTKASGIPFAYDGRTTRMPKPGNIGGEKTGIVIAWTDAAHTPYLTTTGPLGVGGVHWVMSTSGSGWKVTVTHGFVVLNWPLAKGLPGTLLAQGPSRPLLISHELGHAVGLEHAGDDGQVMFATMTPTTPGHYAAGDLAGLARVGNPKGC